MNAENFSFLALHSSFAFFKLLLLLQLLVYLCKIRIQGIRGGSAPELRNWNNWWWLMQ